MTSRFGSWPVWAAPALIGAVAFLAVVAAIDPAGDYPDAPQGPGLTIDESFNVEQGVRLVVGLREWVLGKIAQREIISFREIFGDVRDLPKAKIGYYNPDHPPLGRFWLGLWHHLTATLAPPSQHPANHPFVTACAACRIGGRVRIDCVSLRLGHGRMVRRMRQERPPRFHSS